MKKLFILFVLFFTVHGSQCSKEIQKLQSQIALLENQLKEKNEKISKPIQDIYEKFNEEHEKHSLRLLSRYETECKKDYNSAECKQIVAEAKIRREIREVFEQQVQKEIIACQEMFIKENEPLLQQHFELKMRLASLLNKSLLENELQELTPKLNLKKEEILKPINAAKEKFEEINKHEKNLSECMNQFIAKCGKDADSEECKRISAEWEKRKEHQALFDEILQAKFKSANIKFGSDPLLKNIMQLSEYIELKKSENNNK